MRSLIILAAVTALAAPALADTQAGVEAWERGDYGIAVEQWRAAAATGDADALFNLGQAYKLGRGVPADTWRAEDYYRQAAVRGHAEAADNYGLALFQNGKPRDAVPFLEKSSERANPRAEYVFGTMLFNGVDVPKDWVRAYALTSRSAAAGLPQAAQSLRLMDGYLSAADRQQGLALAQRMTEAEKPKTAAAPSRVPALHTIDLPPSAVAQATDVKPAVARVAPPKPAMTKVPVARAAASVPPVVKQPPAIAVVTNPTRMLAWGRWRVQLGAFADPGNARRLGAQQASRFPDRIVEYVVAGRVTRVLVSGYASRAVALTACGAVAPCVPVAP